ncbi:MAG: hypothetical protein K6F94_01775 [Bacteroidaceae bacterium]|nr:hypothetical protein [Bacteroidaceae bacterium]
MKHFYLFVAMFLASVGAAAQPRLALSTYKGSDLKNYDGQECAVTTSRLICTGWNTIAFPFDLSEQEINEIFGSDCRLEQLVGVESNGDCIRLNFQDCKENGIQAGNPYILHYTGKTMSKRIAKNALINGNYTTLQFTDQKTGTVVRMSGVKEQTEGNGLYGILVRDNAEAAFTCADIATNGFYATRCYISLSSGNKTLLTTNHIAASDVTKIENVTTQGELVDVYSVAGTLVSKRVSADKIKTMQPGIYVIKGRKISVK